MFRFDLFTNFNSYLYEQGYFAGNVRVVQPIEGILEAYPHSPSVQKDFPKFQNYPTKVAINA